MKIKKIAAAFVTLCMLSGVQAFEPSSDIVLIVPYKPGGGSDLGARIIQKYAHRYFNKKFIIRYIPGEGALSGIMALKNAKPDGLTLGYVNFPVAATFMTPPENYLKEDDIQYLCTHVIDTQIVVVNYDSPYKNMSDLIKAGQTGKRRLIAANNGKKASGHYGDQLIAHGGRFDIDNLFLDCTVDEYDAIISNKADFGCTTYAEARPYIEQKKLRVIGTFSEQRLDELKDVQTLKEVGVYDFWYGILRGISAPRGLSEDAIKYYEENFKKLFSDMDVIAEHKKISLNLEYYGKEQYEARAKYFLFFSDHFENDNLWQTNFGVPEVKKD